MSQTEGFHTTELMRQSWRLPWIDYWCWRLYTIDYWNWRLSDLVSQQLSDLASRRLSDSASQRLSDLASQRISDSPTCRVGECLKENSASWRVGDFQTPWVGESLWWVGESLFKFFKIYHHFKRLLQPFKISIWQKRSQGCNVLSPLIYLQVWKKLYL